MRNKPSNSRFPSRNNQRFSNRINQQIRAREVRVVDGETGQQLGIMRTQDAQNLARNRGLDLVEVAAQAEPPVCRIVDYGKFRYQQAKQEKERKAVAARTASKVKELKLRVNIDSHDYMIKMRRSEGFLCEGDKLRVQLMFRGRELAHQELGYDLMMKVIADLKQVAVVEMEPKKMGRNINMTMAPLPANKRKPKFQPLDEDEEDEDDDDFSEVDEDAPHSEENDLDDDEHEKSADATSDAGSEDAEDDDDGDESDDDAEDDEDDDSDEDDDAEEADDAPEAAESDIAIEAEAQSAPAEPAPEVTPAAPAPTPAPAPSPASKLKVKNAPKGGKKKK